MGGTQIDEPIVLEQTEEAIHLPRSESVPRPRSSEKTPSAAALAASHLQKTYGKRRVVDEKYRQLIDTLYAEAEQ